MYKSGNAVCHLLSILTSNHAKKIFLAWASQVAIFDGKAGLQLWTIPITIKLIKYNYLPRLGKDGSSKLEQDLYLSSAEMFCKVILKNDTENCKLLLKMKPIIESFYLHH